MKFRYFKVTALVAVANYDDEMCDEHAGMGFRTALDAVELINDSDDYLLDITEEELHLVPKPHITVIDSGQGPRLPKINNKGGKK